MTNLIVADGQATIEANFIGTHIGEFAGLLATRQAVRVPLCVVYDLANNQITRGRIYFEVPALLQQLGLPAHQGHSSQVLSRFVRSRRCVMASTQTANLAVGNIRQAICSGNTVVQEITWEGTHSGNLVGSAGAMPASGKRTMVPATVWYTFQATRAARFTIIWI